MSQLIFKTTISPTVIVNGNLVSSVYEIKLGLSVGTDDAYQQQVALERIRTLCDSIFSQSIFVNRDSEIKTYLKTHASNIIVEFGQEPYDHIIAMTVCAKCQAVAEDRLLVDDIHIINTLVKDVEYIIDDSISMEEIGSTPWLGKTNLLPWWHRPDLSTEDIVKGKGKNVQLDDPEGQWADLGLGWEPMITLELDDADNEVVAEESAKKKKEGKVITIVPGGKTVDEV